jgi:ABC-type polysaccharide/polyol phosphate transport system ATPase subunit
MTFLLRTAILSKWFNVKVSESAQRYRQALTEITFSLEQGQSFGIIGRNGAGKSTLLKLIAGTLQPDEGTVDVEGHVGGLIELGAGLDPRKTGRQNSIERARLLGVGEAEVSTLVDSIEMFAELGDQFGDPVGSYSSGMKARLGFAIAVSLPFEIMICDEALSVGDARFASKCLSRVNELKSDRIFLFVSHSMTMVRRFCDEAMVLDSGKVVFEGHTGDAVAYFENEVLQLTRETAPPAPEQSRDGARHNVPSYLEPIVFVERKIKTWHADVEMNSGLAISWKFELVDAITDATTYRLGFPVFSSEGVMQFSCTLEDLAPHRQGDNTFAGHLEVPDHGLQPGNYYLMVALYEGIAPALRQVIQILRVDSTGQPYFGAYSPGHSWRTSPISDG